jgi:UDP-3-O-[3-hydroxymyristoyl] glucosamine N-acyltransferase
MVDRRFYHPRGPFSLAELAKFSGAELSAQADQRKQIHDVAPLGAATPEDVSFLDNPRYLGEFSETRAGAAFVHPKHAERGSKVTALLLSEQPYKAYALAAQAFYPFEVVDRPGIDPAAVVDPSATLGDGCQIDPGAVIGVGAAIGARCRIGPNAVVGENVVIGHDGWVGASVSLSHCVIGARVILHPGVRIGQDGFGFAPDPAKHIKVPQLGRVVIHDDVEIGANTTIDRGAGPDTIIGDGCMIDNLVQIGHNVQLGRGCVIVAQVGLSGSVRLDDHVMLGGQVGIAGHLRVGPGAMVAAKSGVVKNLEGGGVYGGLPAVPVRQWHRQTATLSRLAKRKPGESG